MPDERKPQNEAELLEYIQANDLTIFQLMSVIHVLDSNPEAHARVVAAWKGRK